MKFAPILKLITLLALTGCVVTDSSDTGKVDDCENTGDETCDGIDNNCDGVVDEGVLLPFHADTDGDSYGDAGAPLEACTAPDGYVENADDCDDANAAAFPGAAEACNGADDDCDSTVDEADATDAGTWYADTDADGAGDPATGMTSCEQPEGFVADGADCDDADASLNQDDADADGVSTCDGDCDDADGAAYPGAVEACDVVDNNCDGAVDEAGATGESPFYADADGDGYGDTATTTIACDQPAGTVTNAGDCDDASADVNPDAAETCDDLDNNCDGAIDEAGALGEGTWYVDADGDTYGDAATPATACDQPEGTVENMDDCYDASARVSPAAAELCNDIDDDCDGTVDEADATDAGSWYADTDADSFGDASSGSTSCEQPDGFTDDAADCDDTDPDVNPDAVEACDDIDNNCDGVVDEAGATGEGTWYADADGDAYGNPASATTACDQPAGTAATGDDCDDASAGVNPGATEVCNAIDDNCDATVDEGSADQDADGVYDCLDAACTVASASGGTTPVDDTCLAPDLTVTDPWSASVEWQWVGLSTSSSARNSYITPKVGNLTDTDGDGDVDTSDTPNVLVNTFGDGGRLTLLAGDTGAEIWSITGVYSYGENAIVDVDGDGDNDVLTFDGSRRAMLLDASGAVIWTATAAASTSYPIQTVADLDGDGVVEVITTNHVINGQTGATLVTLTAPTSIPYYGPTIGDIDLDGEQEIILGNRVYSPDGTLEWTSSVVGTYGHWSAIVNVDSDPEGEVLMVGGSKVVVHDHDGTVLYTTTTTNAAQPGPICVADFDGDGTVEAAWASQSVFSVYELNATPVWSATVQDNSGLAGCSAYDFNSDGVYEALFADETTFRVFDGATGAVRFSQGGHASGTVFEYPVVADVDNDGSAEILYVSNYFPTGGSTLTVLGHTGGEWPRSGSTWPIHDFSATNIEVDGSVPSNPTPAWQIYNVYRARPAVDSAATNLVVDILDTCASSCDDAIGTVSVSVEVGNEGGVAITEDITLVLYDADTDTALDSVTLVGGLGSGETSASLELTANLAGVGAGGVYVAVDDDGLGVGYLDECDESDNSADWSGPVCL